MNDNGVPDAVVVCSVEGNAGFVDVAVFEAGADPSLLWKATVVAPEFDDLDEDGILECTTTELGPCWSDACARYCSSIEVVRTWTRDEGWRIVSPARFASFYERQFVLRSSKQGCNPDIPAFLHWILGRREEAMRLIEQEVGDEQRLREVVAEYEKHERRLFGSRGSAS